MGASNNARSWHDKGGLKLAFDAERFAANFEVLTKAAGGIKGVREIVLDLAIRGRLSQDRETRGHTVHAENGPFQIPSSWQWTSLGKIARLLRGVSYKKHEAAAEPGQDLLPIVRANNVTDVGLKLADLVYVPRRYISDEQILQVGDLILAMASGSKSVVGKAAYVDMPFDGGFGAFCGLLRPSREVHPPFVARFMQSRFYRELISSTSRGIGINNLRKEDVEKCPFPLPPLAEQKHIVTRVDQLMALIDDLEAKQTKKRDVSTRFTKASLEALTTAESTESLDTAWKRVLENFAFAIDRSAMVGLLRGALIDLAVRGVLTGAKPGAWSNRSLGEVVTETKYGTSKKCDRDASLTPVLRIPNVVGGALDLTDLKYATFSNSELLDLSLREGDLLVVRSNGSKELVGRTSVVDSRASGFAYAGYLVRLRVDLAAVEPAWIELALRGTRLRTQIEKPIRTTTGVHNINTTEILALSLPVPALSEQRAALARIQSLIGLCDDLEAKLRCAEDCASKLVEAVVQEMVA
jgi:type I restriction enzyme, S subunit